MYACVLRMLHVSVITFMNETKKEARQEQCEILNYMGNIHTGMADFKKRGI